MIEGPNVLGDPQPVAGGTREGVIGMMGLWTTAHRIHYVSRACKTIAVAAILAVTACTTPETMLRHPETAQVARCGGNVTGSLAGGMIGYAIQEGNDSKCVSSYIEQGFQRVK